MKENKRIDKTSLIMILAFAVVILAVLICLVVSKLGADDAVNNKDNENVPETSITNENDEKAPEKHRYDNFMDLSDKFLEVCNAGDIDELYNLYYDGFLEGMRLNMEEVPDKETFDNGLRTNMLSVTGFDEYEYGSMELPPTQSPGSYASYIYSMVNNGKSIPLDVSTIENCVNLVVYIDNTYQTNHFMVQIDGYWYFIV